MTSKHYKKSRYKRQKMIDRILKGDGYIIDGFVVDKGHNQGLEVHSITDTGVIIIHNYHTGKLVTKLIARPQQIERYYKDSGRHPPKWLLDLAQWHMDLQYNWR